MENERIRKLSRARGVPLWRIADALEVSEPTLYRRLRYPLSSDEERRISKIIDELGEEALRDAGRGE